MTEGGIRDPPHQIGDRPVPTSRAYFVSYLQAYGAFQANSDSADRVICMHETLPFGEPTNHVSRPRRLLQNAHGRKFLKDQLGEQAVTFLVRVGISGR